MELNQYAQYAKNAHGTAGAANRLSRKYRQNAKIPIAGDWVRDLARQKTGRCKGKNLGKQITQPRLTAHKMKGADMKKISDATGQGAWNAARSYAEKKDKTAYYAASGKIYEHNKKSYRVGKIGSCGFCGDEHYHAWKNKGVWVN